MILIDEALHRREAERRPVRLGMLGAGFMARRGAAAAPLAARHAARGNRQPYSRKGARRLAPRHEQPQDRAVPTLGRRYQGAGRGETTGAVLHGARLIMETIAHGKEVVSLNVELDATVVSTLQIGARESGVEVTGADSAQPAVYLVLAWFVTQEF